MPQTQSRRKHVRQAEKRRERNRSLKKALKVATRAVLEAAAAEDQQVAQSALSAAYKTIDKAVKVGVIHANTAARRKSKLAKKLADMA